MSDLKVFTDDCDWVIAETEQAARAAWATNYGEEYPVEEPMGVMALGATLRIWVVIENGVLAVAEHGQDGADLRRFTTQELVDAFGIGWLCTAEH